MNCSSDTRRQYLRNILRREPTGHEQMMLARVGNIHPFWIRTALALPRTDFVPPRQREARSLIRIALADAFPGIRFGITLGDSKVVTWTGGPSEREVACSLLGFHEKLSKPFDLRRGLDLFLTPSGKVMKQPEPFSVRLSGGLWRHTFCPHGVTRFPTAAEARTMRHWLAGCPSVPDEFASRIRFGRMPASAPGNPDYGSADGVLLAKCRGLLNLAGYLPGRRLWLAKPTG